MSLELSTLRMEYDERGRSEVKTVTDAQGRYRIEFAPASLGNNFFLFFYDVTGFDRVKYRRPEPWTSPSACVATRQWWSTAVLQFEPSWAEVMRQIARFGAESDRGRILRRQACRTSGTFPAVPAPDAEVWWYYADGVNYWFVGDRLTRATQFPPIQRTAPPR